MALNLSTLTSPATSGDVLAEALTTADFLEGVPVLRNLARGSQKGGDAKQDVALNQPKALPLIDGDGYLYCSGVSGNGAVIGQSVLPATGDFDLRINFIYTLNTNSETDIFSQYEVDQTGRFFIAFDNNNKRVKIFWNGFGNIFSPNDSLVVGQRYVLKLTRSGSAVSLYLNDVLQVSHTIGNSIPIYQVNSTVGFAYSRPSFHSLGAIFSVTEGSNTNVDFTATNVRHGDTKFKCATGQVVTVNQSGNDPATIIKKPVLRFANASDDSTSIRLRGLFANNIDSGYMFAAFSVIGDGGASYGRVFSVQDSTDNQDYLSKGVIFSQKRVTTNDLSSYYNGDFNIKNDLFDDDNGDILHEVRILNNQNLSKTNNTVALTDSRDTSSVDSDTFNICRSSFEGSNHSAIDLEYLALFPATITDAEADSVRNYINNRNNVFYRWDTDGYYFFDPLSLSAGAVSTWNGRIVGSDNGDADLNITQATGTDQPSQSGMVVTFADNTDHLDMPAGFVEPAAGSWQIVGSSLGTFAYRVNANAVTELNLLGNLGDSSFRQAGDLYGIILLPATATGKDIEEARKLLIDRGAADGASAVFYTYAWRFRTDIVDFRAVDMSAVTSVFRSWNGCSSMTSFGVTELSNCANFTNAWLSCSALTSFPSGAKLGTAAENVNFLDAWRSSGLTSFPPLDLSTGNNFSQAWRDCSALTDFSGGAKLGTEAANVNFTSAWRSSGLTSFPADIDLSKGAVFNNAFNSCTSLSSFPSIDLSQGTHFSFTWYNTALTEFPYISFEKARTFYAAWYINNSLVNFASGCFNDWNPDSIENNCFGFAFVINNLSSQSVENILVSIDSSGQHATEDGTSNTNPITGTNIDLKYNVATGSLSAATDTAVTSLKAKGWVIVVNNVTL